MIYYSCLSTLSSSTHGNFIHSNDISFVWMNVIYNSVFKTVLEKDVEDAIMEQLHYLPIS